MSLASQPLTTCLAAAPGGALYRVALRLDRVIGGLCAGAGALLVLAEIVVLFTGVVFRYVFNSPLF